MTTQLKFFIAIVIVSLPAFFVLPSCGDDNQNKPAYSGDGDNDAGGDDDDDSTGYGDSYNPFAGFLGGGGAASGGENAPSSSSHRLRSSGVIEMKSKSYKLYIGSIDALEPMQQKSNSFQLQVAW